MKGQSSIGRKVIGIVTAAILTLTLLTACGSGQAGSQDTGNRGSTGSSSQIAWNYVSPSDLKAETASANSGSSKSSEAKAAAGGDATSDNSSKSSTDGDAASGSSDADAADKPAGQPPEKPAGDSDSGKPSGKPSEKPDGDGSSDGSGGAPSGTPGGGSGDGGAPAGGPGGANTASYDYSGTLSGALTADGETISSDGEEIAATESDQNVLLAENGGTLKVTGATLTKSGSDEDGDNCNFYGLNASVLSTGEGSKVYLSDSTISSDSTGSNGVFATDGGEAYVNATQITTTEGGNARGLDATYGGVIYGNDLTVSTEKDHCAALATDRGGGYISVTNSHLQTAGSGSPLIYSTGDIEVDGVTGTASGSQIAGMEGMNRIIINNSALSSTNDDISGSDPIKNGVILYQSTSGDADTASSEVAEFEAVDSTLSTTISDGAMFYATNTSAKVVLQNTALDFDTENVDLLYASGNDANGWGSAGSNGATVTLTGIDQALEGNIYTDDISSVDLTLTEGSSWTGTTEGEENVAVSLDGTSTWVVTADTAVTDLNAAEGSRIVDADGNIVSILTLDGETIVEGESDYVITVTGSYGTELALTEAQMLDTDVLARDDFDSYYDVTTKFGTN